MSHKLLASALGLLAAAAGAALPGAAQAQASASPYTSGTRYDAAGRVTGTLSPNSPATGISTFLATRTTYDAAGRPTSVESGYLDAWQSESVLPASWAGFHLSMQTEMTYDAMGRKTTERVKGSDLNTYSLTQYSYDSYGRLECTAVRMNPAVYGSLPASACTLGTQGSNGPDRITRTIYDAAGQVLQVRRAVGTPIETADVTNTYTPNGKLQYVIDANGNKAELRYDGHDRQVRWVFPSATMPTSFNDATPANVVATAGALNESDYELYGYDAGGNRTSLRKRDGSALSYTYDALNRMTVKVVPGSTTNTRDIYYSYDLHGLMTSARFDSTSGEGVILAYDGFGRKTSETLSMNGVSRTIGSQYDRDSARTRLTQPDGNFVDYNRDGLDRLDYADIQATWPVFYQPRDVAGRLSALYRWNGATANWGPLTSYQYDAVSRVWWFNTDLNGTSYDSTSWFGFNPANQITGSSRDNDLYAWTGYVNVDRSYIANGLNQYSTVAGSGFTYDANGNLTSDGINTYTFDVENRLLTRSGGGTSASLRYDPLGRLYESWGSNTQTIRYLYDGDALIAEYTDGEALLRRYIHGDGAGDDPLLWFEGSGVNDSTIQHLYSDERGSITAVTDGNGNVTYINAYDEYGIPNGSGNDISTRGRFRYTGQAWIPELGMYYYKARMYSPTLGRFMQTDPIGYEDQFNLYAYVANDPVNGTDPTGMQEADKEFKVPQLVGEVKVTYNDSGITIKVDNPVYRGEATLSGSGVSASASSGQVSVSVRADDNGASAAGRAGNTGGNLSASGDGVSGSVRVGNVSVRANADSDGASATARAGNMSRSLEARTEQPDPTQQRREYAAAEAARQQLSGRGSTEAQVRSVFGHAMDSVVETGKAFWDWIKH